MIGQLALGIDLHVTDEFGWWFTGFIDGEGCFFAGMRDKKSKGNWHCKLEFRVNLREDDWRVIRYAYDTLKVGTLGWKKGYKNAKPQVRYVVRKIPDLKHVIIPLFEKYPLKSKKARDFAIWREMVDFVHATYHQAPPGKWEELARLSQKIRQGREYVQPECIEEHGFSVQV